MTSRKFNPPATWACLILRSSSSANCSLAQYFWHFRALLGWLIHQGSRAEGSSFPDVLLKASPTALRKRKKKTKSFFAFKIPLPSWCSDPSNICVPCCLFTAIAQPNSTYFTPLMLLFIRAPTAHSSLWTTSNTQYLSDSRNLTAFELDSLSCSQEHSVLSYSCDLKLFLWTYFKKFHLLYNFSVPQYSCKGEELTWYYDILLNSHSRWVKGAQRCQRGMEPVGWHRRGYSFNSKVRSVPVDLIHIHLLHHTMRWAHQICFSLCTTLFIYFLLAHHHPS